MSETQEDTNSKNFTVIGTSVDKKVKAKITGTIGITSVEVIPNPSPTPTPPAPTPIPTPPTPTPEPTPIPTPPSPPPTPPSPPPTPPSPPVRQPSIVGIVDVINFTTTDSDDNIKKWVDAVKIQADRDISQYWFNSSVNFNIIPKSQSPNSGHWMCGFFDNSDTAGALGWHDVGPNNEPLIKIFTADSEKYGESPSVTLSHEIAETIGDTNADTTIQGLDEQGRPCAYFRENCDPVEALEYDINGVKVSDFVLQDWFNKDATAPGRQLDFLSKCTKPFQILQGGYMEVSYDNGKTWSEIDKFSKTAEKHRSAHSRYNRLYKKPQDQRVRSTFKTV